MSPMSEFQITHYPVFHREIIEIYKTELRKKAPLQFLDGTGGEGGHMEAVLREFSDSEVLYLDRDKLMLKRAEERLGNAGLKSRTIGKELNFSALGWDDLKEMGWENGFDGILLDLGISTYHLTDSGRGFSFRGEEDLDMRLDGDISRQKSAQDIVNQYSLKDLEYIFYTYGEERWTKKIVERILERRRKELIRTNRDLAKIVESAIPRKFWPPKSHPSFRVFQALRIEVNQELKHLESSIIKLPQFLKPGGVMQVISFHSLEDRIVKLGFRRMVQEEAFSFILKKPLLPGDLELEENPPSRSAKLRAIKKHRITEEI